jgi:hypothetical protein
MLCERIFSLASETSLKMRSQRFFARSLVFCGTRLVPSVYYEQGVRIGQGLNMLLNPLFKIPFSELQ